MAISRIFLPAIFLCFGAWQVFAQPPKESSPSSEAKSADRETRHFEREKFDPLRDPAKDFESAKQKARETGQRIILDVGGEWCIWCRQMDDFFLRNPELLAFREKRFIWVKVNMSDENPNQAFLSQFPPIPAYPYLFVLDSEGKLLHSQRTGKLESGKGYSLSKFQVFLKSWAPK